MNFIVFLLENRKTVLYVLTACIVLCFLGYSVYTINTWYKSHKLLMVVERNLEICQVSNQKLAEFVKANEEKYQQTVNAIVEKSQTQIKTVEVPKVVTKQVIVDSEDCKRMCAMIDDFRTKVTK